MSRACSGSLSFAALLASVLAVHGEDTKKPHADLYGDPLPPGAVMRLGTIRLQHAQADVVFSKDGKQLISWGTDGEVRIWDAATGALLRRSRLDGKPGDWGLQWGHIALSPDGATAAVWGNERTLVLFDTATGKPQKRLSTHPNSPYPLLRISANGKRVAVQDFDHPKARTLFRLWDTVGGGVRLLELAPALNSLDDLTFAPDGKYLAGIGSPGYQLFLWDALTGKVLRTPKDGGAVKGRAVAFSPDGKTLAVSSYSDASVRLWDVDAWKEKRLLPVPDNVKNSSTSQLAFSPDGHCLAGGYGEITSDSPAQQGVLLWDLSGSKKARRLPQRSNCRLRFAPDGKTLACNGGGEIVLWDVATGRRRHLWVGQESKVETLAVSPDGQTIASSAAAWKLRLWNAKTGKPLAELEPAGSYLNPCLFSPDGKRLLTVSDCPKEGTCLQSWDIAKRKELLRFLIPPRCMPMIDALGMSADGKRIWATVREQLHVWDADTGKLLSKRSYRMEPYTISFGGLGANVREVYRDHTVLSPDGVTMTIWQGIEEVTSGCLLASLPKELGSPKLFSNDGRLLAAAIVKRNYFAEDGHKGLALFEAASGDELFRWNIGKFDYLAFTPDDRGVIAADKEQLRVWDTSAGTRLFQMRWPVGIRDADGKANICSLAALPGGRVATGMTEGDILIWDLQRSTWPAANAVTNRGAKEVETLWADLAGDARKSQHAIAYLAAMPARIVPILRERLQPAKAMDALFFETLLAKLDSDDFSVRQSASREMAGLCDRIEPRLRRALRDRPSLEMRRRLEDILTKPRRPSAERLRTLRAIAVLECIGTSEARQILEKLAGGAASLETRAAQQTLQRLKHRDAWTKGRSSP